MSDVLWTIVVIFWLVMFITLSVTHIKAIRVGGGLFTMCSSTIMKEKMLLRIVTVLYLTLGILLFHKYSYPAFDDSNHVSQYFFVWIGIVMFLISIFLFVSARITIGSNWSWSGEMIRDKTKLIMTGPYETIRHPQYTAYVLSGIATGLILTELNIILFMLFVLPLLYWRAFVEEQHLSMIFREYKNYKKKTGMFF